MLIYVSWTLTTTIVCHWSMVICKQKNSPYKKRAARTSTVTLYEKQPFVCCVTSCGLVRQTVLYRNNVLWLKIDDDKPTRCCFLFLLLLRFYNTAKICIWKQYRTPKNERDWYNQVPASNHPVTITATRSKPSQICCKFVYVAQTLTL